MIERKSPQSFFYELTSNARRLRQPVTVVFELTYGCNLRCVHCLNPTHQSLPEELNTAEVLRFLREAVEFGVLEVTFTGGELFTRPDLIQILEKARELGLMVTLVTNATRLSEPIVRKLAQLGIRVHVSIYGASAQVYESVTGIRGSYGKFKQGLRLLSDAKILTTAHIPVMTINRSELSQARELARSLGFQFQYCFDIHPRQDGHLGPLQYRLSPEDKLSVIAEMGEQLQSCRGDAGGSERFIDCECGQSKFAMTPYGEMNLCTAFPTPHYDWRRGSIREGWEILKQTVDAAVPGANYQCPSCEFKKYCRQGKSDAWLEEKEMSVCLPHFREMAAREKEYHAPHVS